MIFPDGEIRINGQWVSSNTSEMIGLAFLTADLCVAALVYLIAGLCCRLASPYGGWGTSVALGIALSLAYFRKAAMLPLGVGV